MSIRVISRVWDHSKQTGTNLVIMLALADWAGEDSRCWPSIETLTQRSRVDERHVRRVLRQLEAEGEIYTSPGQGRGNTNLYLVCVGMTDQQMAEILVKHFDMSILDAMQVAESHRALQGKGDIYAQKGAHMSPFIEPSEPEKGTSTREKGTSTREKGTSRPPRTVKNHQEPLEDNDKDRERAPDSSSSSSDPPATESEPTPKAQKLKSAMAPPPDEDYLVAAKCYEQNIGMLTPIISDSIKAALKTHPPDWIPRAIEVAVRQEKRAWGYVEGILNNWEREGFKNGRQRQSAATTGHQRSVGADRPKSWADYQPGEFDADLADELNSADTT